MHDSNILYLPATTLFGHNYKKEQSIIIIIIISLKVRRRINVGSSWKWVPPNFQGKKTKAMGLTPFHKGRCVGGNRAGAWSSVRDPSRCTWIGLLSRPPSFSIITIFRFLFAVRLLLIHLILVPESRRDPPPHCFFLLRRCGPWTKAASGARFWLRVYACIVKLIDVIIRVD